METTLELQSTTPTIIQISLLIHQVTDTILEPVDTILELVDSILELTDTILEILDTIPECLAIIQEISIKVSFLVLLEASVPVNSAVAWQIRIAALEENNAIPTMSRSVRG